MNKKLGLCLGAGGARGVAHIGFLQALEEEDIKPDCIAGCSMGSVVGGAYCCGVPLKKIHDVVFHLRMVDIVQPDFRLFSSSGLFKTDKIKKLLRKFIGTKTFEETDIPFRCNATDLITGENHVFSEGDVVDAVTASSSMPTIFRPTVMADGSKLVDGGIMDRVPASLCKDMGADVIVCVDVLASLKGVDDIPDSTAGVLLRMVDVMDCGKTRLLREQRKDIIDLWVEPELGNMSQYALKDLQFAYDKGYECARENIGKIKELLK